MAATKLGEIYISLKIEDKDFKAALQRKKAEAIKAAQDIENAQKKSSKNTLQNEVNAINSLQKQREKAIADNIKALDRQRQETLKSQKAEAQLINKNIAERRKEAEVVRKIQNDTLKNNAFGGGFGGATNQLNQAIRDTQRNLANAARDRARELNSARSDYEKYYSSITSGIRQAQVMNDRFDRGLLTGNGGIRNRARELNNARAEYERYYSSITRGMRQAQVMNDAFNRGVGGGANVMNRYDEITRGMRQAQVMNDKFNRGLINGLGEAVKAQKNFIMSTIETTKNVLKAAPGFAIATAAVGTFYTAIRTLKNELISGFQAVEDFKLNTISMAAFITTFSKQAAEGDISGAYQRASDYAGQLVQKLEIIDALTIANAQDLRIITESFIKQGVLLDVNNKKQVDSFVNITNALKLLTRGQNQQVQLRQEVRALVNGELRDTNVLVKTLSAIDPQIKEHLKTWREEGVLIEKVGELLKGFGPAGNEFKKTWAAVGTTTQTIHDKILRGAFLPTYELLIQKVTDFNRKLLDVNTGKLTDFGKKIQDKVTEILEDTKSTIELIFNLIKGLPEGVGIGSSVGLLTWLLFGPVAGAATGAIAALIDYADGLQKIANIIAGFKAVDTGEMSFFTLATSNAEELKKELEKINKIRKDSVIDERFQVDTASSFNEAVLREGGVPYSPFTSGIPETSMSHFPKAISPITSHGDGVVNAPELNKSFNLDEYIEEQDKKFKEALSNEEHFLRQKKRMRDDDQKAAQAYFNANSRVEELYSSSFEKEKMAVNERWDNIIKNLVENGNDWNKIEEGIRKANKARQNELLHIARKDVAGFMEEIDKTLKGTMDKAVGAGEKEFQIMEKEFKAQIEFIKQAEDAYDRVENKVNLYYIDEEKRLKNEEKQMNDRLNIYENFVKEKDRYNAEYEELYKQRLDNEVAAYRLTVKNEEIIAKYVAEKMKEYEMAKLAASNKFIDGVKLGAMRITEEQGGYAQKISNAWVDAWGKAGDALTDFLIDGKANFTDFANSVIKDMLRIMYQEQFIKPLMQSGSDSSSSLFGLAIQGIAAYFRGGTPAVGSGYGDAAIGVADTQGLGSMYAKGGIFNQRGLVPFARGGVVSSPTVFPFANGTGLMGEAGPEAIMPLKRNASGKLGVEASGENSSGETLVVNYAPVIQAIDTQSGLQFLGRHKEEIVGLVHHAYRKIGRKGVEK